MAYDKRLTILSDKPEDQVLTLSYTMEPTAQKFHACNDRVRQICGPVGCLSGDTEVLTPNGWFRIDQWNGQPILEWDVRHPYSAGVYKVPEKYHVYFCDTLVWFHGPNVSMRVTYDHRMPIYNDDNIDTYIALDARRFRMSAQFAFELNEEPVYILKREREYTEILEEEAVFVDERKPTDGKCYCFTTSTGYFVARHNGHIFVTGNSGKSTMCVWEMLFRCMRQTPNKFGVRESKWLIVRNTYPELLNTTFRTFKRWLPIKELPDAGYSLRVNYSKPMIAKLTMRLPKGYDGCERETTVEAEFIFQALEEDADVTKLKSFDVTGVWVNESAQISRLIFTTLNERIGRFPDKGNGVDDYWLGVILDTNPPDIRHWIVELFEKEKPKGYSIFHQPPGVLELPKKNPHDPTIYIPNMGQGAYPPAENVKNLVEGYDYYMERTKGATREYIRNMLMGFYGAIMAGKPVYGEYIDEVHCAKEEIKEYRGMPLLVSFDYGSTVTVAITQLSPRGQFRIIDELCSGLEERDLKGKPKDRYFCRLGVRNFAKNYLIPYLANRYGGMEIIYTGDPAGSQKSQNNETSCIEELAMCGITVTQARTNLFLPRREAVEAFMLRREGFAISPRCLMGREGFQKEYKYRAVNKPNGIVYTDEPEKNMWSHVQDAIQYAALYWESSSGRMGGGSQIPGASGYAPRVVEDSGYSSYV